MPEKKMTIEEVLRKLVILNNPVNEIIPPVGVSESLAQIKQIMLDMVGEDDEIDPDFSLHIQQDKVAHNQAKQEIRERIDKEIN